MASLIQRISNNFLVAFPEVDTFEVGIRLAEENAKDGIEKMRISAVGREALLSEKYLKYLKAMNIQQQHIYIRPTLPNSYTVIDDVLPEKLGWAEYEGLEPCAAVETSPGNYQLWLKHSEVMQPALSTQASRILAEWFDGDPSSADFKRFGRFPGFTNPKPKHKNASGQSPFSRLQHARDRVFTKSIEVLEIARVRLEVEQEQKKNLARTFAVNRKTTSIKSWEAFEKNPRYQGDLNRVDIAYAMYALSRGIPRSELFSTLSQRDLSHKGSTKRQEAYIDRTIKKAEDLIS
jgi:hypothetical protein